MFQLTTTVLAISLAAATTLISIKYTNPTLPLQQETQQQIERGFQSLQMGWDAYRAEKQAFEWKCETLTTSAGTYESCKQALSDPGYLPVAGWSSALIPQYAFMPRPPKGLNWSYGTNSEGWYFCAEGAINDVQLKGVRRAQLRFPLQTLVVSSACGAISDVPNESLNLSAMKITYWVKRHGQGPDAFSILTLPQGAPPAYVARLSFFEKKSGWNELPGPGPGGPVDGVGEGTDSGGGGGKNCNGKGNPLCAGNGNGNGNGKNCNGIGNPNCVGNGNSSGDKKCNGKGNPNCSRAKGALAGRAQLASGDNPGVQFYNPWQADSEEA